MVDRRTSWIDPRVVPGPSAIHSHGVFAMASIAADEIVVVWGGDASRVYRKGAVAIAAGLYLGGAPDASDLMNHSCGLAHENAQRPADRAIGARVTRVAPRGAA